MAMSQFERAQLDAVYDLRRFVPSFADVESEYWDDTNEGLSYPLLGALVTYLAKRVAKGDLADLPAFMAATERWLTDGDLDVQNLVMIEVLEGLHHLPQVIPFLGPRSRYWWNQQLWWLGGEEA
jgi:hypothetical protein